MKILIFLTTCSALFFSCSKKELDPPQIQNEVVAIRSPSVEEKSLISLMNQSQEFTTISSKVDYYSTFIFENSMHDSYSPATVEDPNDTDKLAKAVLDYLSNKTTSKPIMRCGHRNNLLKALLQIENIQSRLVNILGNGQPLNTLLGHVILEYKNEDKKWILADADYLIYWKLKDSSQRIGSKEAIQLDYTAITPCQIITNECGYNTKNSELGSPQSFIDYGIFTSAIIVSSQYGQGNYEEFYFNTKKLSPNTVIEGQTVPERYNYLPITYF